MFNPSREQARDFFFEAWRKYQAHEPLSDLEAIAVEHIGAHREYHAILQNPARHREREWTPESGDTNPFLHLALHLTISEQLSIDQPAGVRAAYQRMLARGMDAHAAQHEVMECLAEMIWQTLHDRQPPDVAAYLRCLEHKVGV